MKLSKAAKIWIDYHRTHSKKIRCEHKETANTAQR